MSACQYGTTSAAEGRAPCAADSVATAIDQRHSPSATTWRGGSVTTGGAGGGTGVVGRARGSLRMLATGMWRGSGGRTTLGGVAERGALDEVRPSRTGLVVALGSRARVAAPAGTDVKPAAALTTIVAARARSAMRRTMAGVTAAAKRSAPPAPLAAATT